MDQVSRPMQILLLAVVAFGALWFFALRPKGDSGGGGGSAAPAKPAAAAPPTATSPAHGPGSSLPGGLGRAVQKARGAAGQSDATNQRLQQASGGATAANATPAAPANASAVAARAAAARAAAARRTATAGGAGNLPGPRLSTNNAAVSSLAVAGGLFAAGFAEVAGAKLGVPSPRVAATGTAAHGVRIAHVPVHRPAVALKATSSPAAVSAAMANGKVVVLLFWNGRASDDRRVHDEFAAVSSHGGRVLLVAAPVGQVSRFASSIRGVQVLQSPTVVVVDRSHQARTLVGYTDRAEIGQAVDDALVGR